MRFERQLVLTPCGLVDSDPRPALSGASRDDLGIEDALTRVGAKEFVHAQDVPVRQAESLSQLRVQRVIEDVLMPRPPL